MENIEDKLNWEEFKETIKKYLDEHKIPYTENDISHNYKRFNELSGDKDNDSDTRVS